MPVYIDVTLLLYFFLCSSESESGSQSVCDQLVTPTALAACTRVDSCFTPWFVPALGVSVQFAHLDLHLCHHLDQLGSGMYLTLLKNTIVSIVFAFTLHHATCFTFAVSWFMEPYAQITYTYLSVARMHRKDHVLD